MRSISRVVDVSINTVSKLLIDAGNACAAFHDAKVRDVKATKVQCDEIWSYCYAKKSQIGKTKKGVEGQGDVWTWTALDADSKLIISWFVGNRDGKTAYIFLEDLKDRLADRVQLTSDAFSGYLDAVHMTFGFDVDYAQLQKIFRGTPEGQRRYSPGECIGVRKRSYRGDPDPKHVSTSFVERQNLTMRMSMRRFTRLTNAFSKKFENHAHMVALYTVWYNFVRTHKTHKLSPAMSAGITDTLMSMNDLAEMIDATLPKPGRPKTYKRAQA